MCSVQVAWPSAYAGGTGLMSRLYQRQAFLPWYVDYQVWVSDSLILMHKRDCSFHTKLFKLLLEFRSFLDPIVWSGLNAVLMCFCSTLANLYDVLRVYVIVCWLSYSYCSLSTNIATTTGCSTDLRHSLSVWAKWECECYHLLYALLLVI